MPKPGNKTTLFETLAAHPADNARSVSFCSSSRIVGIAPGRNRTLSDSPHGAACMPKHYVLQAAISVHRVRWTRPETPDQPQHCFTGDHGSFGLKRTRVGPCRTRTRGADSLVKPCVLNTAIGTDEVRRTGSETPHLRKAQLYKQFLDLRIVGDSKRTPADSPLWRR